MIAISDQLQTATIGAAAVLIWATGVAALILLRAIAYEIEDRLNRRRELAPVRRARAAHRAELRARRHARPVASGVHTQTARTWQ